MTPELRPTWLDRAVGVVSPKWQVQRMRARIAGQLMLRHYEANATGRRTQGWRKSSGDANAVVGPALTSLRENARDLVRNNSYAASAVDSIADHSVGYGIVGKPANGNKAADEAWKRWAETTACDADGRHDIYGLQKLVMRTVVESGEVLIRRRLRRPEDGLPLPIQIQVIDPDYLDTTRDTAVSPGAGQRIIQGVQFDAIGRRLGYWLFPEHPGSAGATFGGSVFVPAESVRHVFKSSRPGQVRGPSWFAAVMLMMKDHDEFADATLMKAKIAACLSVILSGDDGLTSPLGTTTTTNPDWDFLEPGLIKQVASGQTVTVVDPPRTGDYDNYSKNVLRGIAAGLGVTYEDLTGDYTDMPFSAARMSQIQHQKRIHDWRWRILIPQFCDPVWSWVMEAAVIMGQVKGAAPAAKWTPPPFPMVDPANEGLAEMRNVRAGLKSLSEMIRERGYDPDDLLAEMASDNKKLDKLGIILDSDPRKMTQAGQAQAVATPADEPPDDEIEADNERRFLRWGSR